MNRNILWFWMGAMFCVAMPLCAQQSTVEKSADKAKKDYRIEEERGESGRRSRVNLVSPEGKLLKSFAPNDVAIAKSGKYLLHQSVYRAQEEKGYLEKEKTLYSVKGEKKWTRIFRSYPASWDPEVGDPSWGSAGISDDGDRSYFNWRDDQGNYCIGVYNEAGKELAKTCRPEAIYKVEISPDGRIVGAETYLSEDGRNIKHLLFLEADTGKMKLVRAENDTGYASANPHAVVNTEKGMLPRFGCVTIYWDYRSGATSESKIVKYADIPNDISALFPLSVKEK